MRKRSLTFLLTAALCVSSMCSISFASSEEVSEAVTESAAAEADDGEEEEYTGDASLDDPGNQDQIGERELLIVSFGTSYNDSRRLTIGAIEDAAREAFPEWSVRRAFTSDIIIDHIRERDGVDIDTVEKALDRAVDNGVKELAVLPTHIMNGFEYEQLEETLAAYADSFEKVHLADNLLAGDEEFRITAEAIAGMYADRIGDDTALVLMGHGTEAESNSVYAKMQDTFRELGFEDIYVGTVEAEPALDDVTAALAEKDYKNVILRPFMVVAGDHANNDMADAEDPESWYSILSAKGYNVTCDLEGIAQIPDILQLYIVHAEEMINEADAKASASLNSGKVADSSATVETENVLDDWMEPVKASDIQDGLYDIEVRSSSSMFKIAGCELMVLGDEMSAFLKIESDSYLFLYPGTAEEAAKASDEELILPEKDDDGANIFEVPVDALDDIVNVAAYSRKKEQWYDRMLCFVSSSLPGGAAAGSGDMVTVSDLGLEDGEYLVQAQLEGGSGRASIESPAFLEVSEGNALLRVVFSSPHYDYMIVDEERYDRVNTEGNSEFEIPVAGFDCHLSVKADTTAMSKPYEIDYTIFLSSETIEPAA